jgi:hypothetical protein
MPNIPIKPGPIIVSIPLSFTPSKKKSKAKFHFYKQKMPINLTTVSKQTSMNKVVLNPFESAICPQRGAPTTAEAVTKAEQ